MDEITILDKTYISSKRAAEITGYAKDYVGQLCREGHVDAKMVGRSWYVFEPSIRKHRFGDEGETETVTQNESLESTTQSESKAPEVPEIPVWEPSSVYKAESVEMIPELQVPLPESVSVVSSVYKPEEVVVEDSQSTLTDMQSAWREWFDRKQELRIESPEVIDTRNIIVEEEISSEEESIPEDDSIVEDEFSIPIHKMTAEEEFVQESDTYEEPEAEQFIPIQRIQPVAVDARTPNTTKSFEAYPEGIIRNERIIKKGSKSAASRAKRRSRSNAPAIAILVAISMISISIAAIGTGYAERYLKGQAINNPIIKFLVGDSSFKR